MAFRAQIILAASLVAIAGTSAMAQSNPAGNEGSNRSKTATGITADNKAPGLNTADVKSKSPAPSQAAKNPHVEGDTGTAIVPGSESTIAKDRSATVRQKTQAR